MKKLTFKVSNPKEGSIIAFVKKVNKIACRLQLDIENGFVTAENVDDTMIETVIELVDNYYTLLGVDIDNNLENDVTVSIAKETTDVSVQAENDSEPKATAKILEPQSEDDLIIKKVEFENEYVEQIINKFLRTAYWAMFKKNVPEKEIGGFIYTSMSEISMRYNNEDSIPFSVGDVVDCNYGIHLGGEINGDHVFAIVCNILDNMAYLVPITKMKENLKSHSYLMLTDPNGIVYDRDYTGGTVLLDKGKYVRSKRVREVIGKTSPEFLAKVLHQLATTFDFTDANLTEKQQEAENATTENVFSEKASESTATIVETKPTSKNSGNVESALLEVVGSAFDKLTPSKKVEEQIDSFLTDIGMSINERMVKQSFVIACDIKKITYENVILELHNVNPEVNEDIIKATLKENFKKWLEQYPELAKKCPKMSLMSVLKVFAKRLG